MANTKISNLTGAASVTDTSVFPVVDSGSTKKVTGTQIKTYARSGLSTVAASGSYTDLTNKPTLFDGNYNSLTNKPTLFDGSYSSLSSKPTIPSDISDLTDTNSLLSSSPTLDEYGNFYTGNFFAAGAGFTGYGGSVYIRASRPDAGSTLDFEFKENGQFKLPPGGDIVDSTGTSVLGGSASTGSITFADNSMIGTGDVVIGFDQVASPAVNFSFTTSGVFIAPVIETGMVAVGGASLNTTDMVECLPNVDTVVYTSRDILTSTIKALFHVEGTEQGTSVYEAQSCEMMVARMSNRVSGSVYGLAYTSTLPLATFNARYNQQADIVEITCRPASTTDAVYVRTTATEMLTTP